LRHSALIVALTLAGLALVWLAPVIEILVGRDWRFAFALTAFALAAMSYMPTLARYGAASSGHWHCR